jgi:ABC-type sulfate/molybdate transport systems ATPase subunit
MPTQIAVIYQGRVIQVAPPRVIYKQPTDIFVAAFLGQANLITGTVHSRPMTRWPLLSVIGKSCSAMTPVQPFEPATWCGSARDLNQSSWRRQPAKQIRSTRSMARLARQPIKAHLGVRSRRGGYDPQSPRHRLERDRAAPTWRGSHAGFCPGDDAVPGPAWQ